MAALPVEDSSFVSSIQKAFKSFQYIQVILTFRSYTKSATCLGL